MAQVRGITWQSNRDDFLKSEDITTLINQLRGFDNIDRDSLETIKNEMRDGGGLSDSALNLDGEAPLNRIAINLSDLIDASCDKIRELNSTIKSDGNTHRKDEADKYFNGDEGVRRRYNTILLKNFRDARDEYNANRNYTKEDPSTLDPNGKPITITYQYDEAVIVATDDTAPELVQIDDRSPYAAAVKEAFQAAKDFWDGYYIPAKELYDETSGLETGTSGSATTSTTTPTTSTTASTTTTRANSGSPSVGGAVGSALVLASPGLLALGTYGGVAAGMTASAAALATLPAAAIVALVGASIYAWDTYDIGDLIASGEWVSKNVPSERPI